MALSGYFVEHVEYTDKVLALNVYCDEGIRDGGKRRVKVAVSEEGVELTACEGGSLSKVLDQGEIVVLLGRQTRQGATAGPSKRGRERGRARRERVGENDAFERMQVRTNREHKFEKVKIERR